MPAGRGSPSVHLIQDRLLPYQEKEHGLAYHFPGKSEQAATLGRWELIGTLDSQTFGSLLVG